MGRTDVSPPIGALTADDDDDDGDDDSEDCASGLTTASDCMGSAVGGTTCFKASAGEASVISNADDSTIMLAL